MVARGAVWTAVVGVLALGIVSCETAQVDDGSALADDVAELRLTTADISGWSERPDADVGSYVIQVGGELCNPPIDGACDQYTSNGVVKTLIQYLTRPADPVPYKFDGYVMDFGTAAQARVMFDDAKGSAATTIAGFADSVAIVNEQTPSFGCTVYAHFGKFYIEIRLSGYDPASVAIADAATFVRVYSEKITGN